MSACAGIDREPRRIVPAFRCTEVVGVGTAFGRGQAAALAEIDIAQQSIEVRGYLLNAVLRRIRRTGQTVRCEPYQLGGGFTHCTVIARFCGR